MKKLIYGGLFLALVGIVFVACKKETVSKNLPKNMVKQQSTSQNKESNNSVINMEPAYSKSFVENVIKGAYSKGTDINYEKSDGEKWRRFWRKVGKWFKDHSGSHLFKNCMGNGACGPCPGICIGGGIISPTGNENSDTVTKVQYTNGYRAYGIDILVDTNTNKEFVAFKFYKNIDAYTNNGFFYIPKDLKLSNYATKELEEKSIEIIKGKYYVVFDKNTGYYYALVGSKIIH